MARLTDPELSALFREALADWNTGGAIIWKKLAAQWLDENLEGYSQKAVGRLMHEFVESGGEIDQVREQRPEYAQYEFHFDLRISIEARQIYIETLLVNTRTGPVITVVSIHDV